MGYFKSIDQMKKIAEEKKALSPTERGRQAISEAAKRIERKKQIEKIIEEAWTQRLNEAASALLSNRPIYEAKLKEAMENNDEGGRVIYQRLLSLADNFEIIKDGLNTFDIDEIIEAVQPDSQGNVNINEVKKMLASISKLYRRK